MGKHRHDRRRSPAAPRAEANRPSGPHPIKDRRSTLKTTDVPAGSLFLAVPAMEQPSATPLSYLAEIVAMSKRHGGELAVGVGGVVAVVITALATLSLLQGQAFGGLVHVLFVLLPFIGAVLLLEAAVAAWRLYRRQEIALATTRSLLVMNAADRADLERHLLRRYRRREVRIEERNAARIERMAGEIAALEADRDVAV